MEMSLILIIVFASLIVFLLLFFSLYYFISEHKKHLENGVKIYLFDTNMKIKMEKVKSLSITPNFKKEHHSSSWITFEEEFSYIVNPSSKQLIRKTMDELIANKSKNISINFVTEFKNFGSKKFNVSMSWHMSENIYYILVCKWDIVSKEPKKIKNSFYEVNENKLSFGHYKYFGFVAFNLNQFEDNIYSFFKIISIFWKLKNQYFLSNNMLIIIFHSNESSKILKKINKFLNVIKLKCHNLGLKQFYTGSSYHYVQAQTLKSKNDQVHLIQTLLFLANISNEKKIDFVSLFDPKFQNYSEDYNFFMKNFDIFQESILSKKNISIHYEPIKKFGSSRMVSEFIVPKINVLDEDVFKMISKNLDRKKEFLNTCASIVTTIKVHELALVDIDLNWLLQNKDTIINKKLIFVLNFYDKTNKQELITILEKMNKEKFLFGIRIFEFSDITWEVLKSNAIKFAVIDKSVINIDNFLISKNYGDLVRLSEFSKSNQNKLRIICDAPSINFDSIIANKIGLDYYFN